MIAAVRDHPVAEWATVVDASTQVVDVREPREVLAGTLPGAINIPLGELSTRLGELDSRRRTVVLCRSGGRSTLAAQHLVAAGFEDVINLAGGMLAYEPNRTQEMQP